jgi:hypothetical protein
MCVQNVFSSLNFTTGEKIENYINLYVEYKRNFRKNSMVKNKTSYYYEKYYGSSYNRAFR